MRYLRNTSHIALTLGADGTHIMMGLKSRQRRKMTELQKIMKSWATGKSIST